MAECAHVECPPNICTVWPARCSECLGSFRRRRDGTIRTHGPNGNRCAGGGKPPAVEPAAPAPTEETP